jgi:hypothetical protein
MPTYQRMRSVWKNKEMKRPVQKLLSKKTQLKAKLQEVMKNIDNNYNRK